MAVTSSMRFAVFAGQPRWDGAARRLNDALCSMRAPVVTAGERTECPVEIVRDHHKRALVTTSQSPL